MFKNVVKIMLQLIKRMDAEKGMSLCETAFRKEVVWNRRKKEGRLEEFDLLRYSRPVNI